MYTIMLMSYSIVIIVILCIIIILKRRGMNSSKERTSDDSHKYYRVNMSDYNNYIFMRNSTEEYLIKKINSFDFELCDEKNNLEYNIIDKGSIIIKCFEGITFYDYQNLASWLLGLNKDIDRPDLTVALSLHKSDDKLSYYARLDDTESLGDSFVGVFNDGEKFSIFLPECYDEHKNMKFEDNNLSIVGIKEYMDNMGVNIDYLIRDMERFSNYININK